MKNSYNVLNLANTMKNVLNLNNSLRHFFLAAMLLLCSSAMFANEYQLNAAATSWANVDFTVSSGGNYEYYESTVTPEFWFNLSSKTSGTISSILNPAQPGFNGTDIDDVGQEVDNTMYYVDPSPAHYYVIVWYPSTDFNSNSYPVICASTTLPNDASLPVDGTFFSAVPIAASDTYVSSKTYDNTVTPAQATVTGGTLYVSNDHSSNVKFIRATGGYDYNGDPVFCFSGARAPFKVQSNIALEPGDVIQATLRVFGGNAADGNGLWFFTSVPPYVPASAPTTKATTTSTATEWKTVSYTVTTGDALDGQTMFYVNAPHIYTCFTNFEITRPSCVAPTSVSVTGSWDYFGGETITLEASYTGGTGSPSYQWQKLINSTWTDLTNGTVDGVTISGATTDNLQISNCGYGNSGKYRCIVSTGSGCETASATATDGSQGYGVRVYALECYTGGTTVYNFTRVGNTKSGTVQINLAANTSYQFKVHADNDYYGNNGTINKDETNWVCTTDQGNLTIASGLGGVFTITMDYSTAGNNSTEGVPEISVLYPRKTIYLLPNSNWKSSSAKFAIYYFRSNEETGWSGFMTPYICNSNVYTVDIPQWNGVKMIAVRLKNTTVSPGSWDDKWNQTSDLTVTSNDYITITGWDNSQTYTTFTPPTYTITFNNGGGSGSMSNMVVNCGEDATLTANTFTRTDYIFTGWYANVAVTINGSSVSAGTLISDGATLQNVTSNIALTAQWEEITGATIPGTVDKANHDSHSADMTWYGDSNEYFDFETSTTRWIQWQVTLLASGKYTVTEEFQSVYTTFWLGHQWHLELIDAGSNVVSSYNTTAVWESGGVRTDAVKWDLSSVSPGVYTLRVTNPLGGSQPKLKSITFAFAGLSVSYTKVPNRDLYGREGDSSRANGEINEPVTVETTGIVPGSSVDTLGNTLTIGSITITAPDSVRGVLYNIPATGGGVVPPSGCDWRFREWRHVPSTVTGDLDSLEAVYFPTFNVDYNTNGGIINDDPYTHWYEYTGLEADVVQLPVNVTKPGYVFAGWYQTSTTELFTYLTCNYYGDYSKGASCHEDRCDYRLKAHWVLPCDEPQTITKVTVTGSGTSSYTTDGYDGGAYAGTPVVSVGATTAAFDVDGNGSNETGYELSSDNDIVFATIKTGTTFRVGDHILVAVTRKNTSRTIDGGSNTNMIALYYGTGAADAHILVNLKIAPTPPDTWEGIYEYILDADDVLEMTAAGAIGVGVWRDPTNGENPCIYSVEVRGCRDLIFDDNHGTHVWSDPANWAPTYTEIPSYYQATRIIKPCIVNIADAHAKSVKLCREFTGYEGSLTITDTAALEVTQRVSEVRGLDYNTLYDVSASNLLIKSTATHQGALAHGDEGSHTHATVEFYSRATGMPSSATWQYMGVPFSDVSRAEDHYGGSWMCRWDETKTGDGNVSSNWDWVTVNDPLEPFVGYCLSNTSAKTFTNYGTLVPSVDQTLSLTYAGADEHKGWNMFANSWMAPINIAQFEDEDFGDGVEKTIYLFNTGTNPGNQATQPQTSTPGQYVAVPINTAGSMWEENRYIAPMQGFYLVTTAAASVTLRYALVRNPLHGALSTLPNRAPKRTMTEGESQMPRIIFDVTGNRFADRLYVFENAGQTNAFDNGWDGYKFEGEDYAPQLMTRTGDLDLAVDVSPSFDGKRIAFRPGEDAEYTLHFSTTEEGLRLRDLLTNDETAIEEGGTYTFVAFNTETEERFEIIDYRNVIGVTTDLDKIYDSPAGEILELTVYTADGRLVEYRTADFNKPLNLPQTGIYIVRLKTTAGMQVCKIKF